MTREDKREKEINDAIETHMNGLFEDRVEIAIEDYKNIQDAFVVDAQWADKHSKSPWISVKDDLPCNHEELISYKDATETILVLANIGGIIGITKMVKNSHTSEWIWATHITVYHWMPMPPLPKE